MDKIQRALNKLRLKERQAVKVILQKLANRNFSSLDLQKFKGRDDIYRVRKGGIRIICRSANGQIFILAIERRSDTTYHP